MKYRARATRPEGKGEATVLVIYLGFFSEEHWEVI